MKLRIFTVLVALLALCFSPVVRAQKSTPSGGKGAAASPLTAKEIQRAVAKSPKGEAAQTLAKQITGAFGKANLEKGRARPRIEDTVVAWAAIAEDSVVVVRADGTTVGSMTKLGSGGVQVLAVRLPNFSDFDYSLIAGGKKIGGGHVRVEHYEYGADSSPQKGVPQGTVTRHTWDESAIFPNTTREYLVYVPAQYEKGTPAALMLWQDGLRHADPKGPMRATTVFDNLIAKGEMPVTIGVFINPGAMKDQKPGEKPRNRSFEYDSLGDAYVRFLRDEILAEVGKTYTLSEDPAMRAIAGGSSGGICAWTAAWEMPDQFGKVLCWVGTFVDIRGGHAYPPMVRKTEKKPIRAYLLAGSNDLDNQYGNWPLANQQMAKALEYSGYDYHLHYGKCFHGSKHMGAMLPEALRWLFRRQAASRLQHGG